MQHLAGRLSLERPRRPPYSSATVTWLELFYDLVMVAAIIVFSHSLSVQPRWEIALKTLVIFTVLWWVWLITTLLVNADPRTNTRRRGLLFAQMLTPVLPIIVGSHTEIPWREPLAPIVGVLLIVVAALHEVTRRTRKDVATFAATRRNAFLVAAVLATISGYVPLEAAWVLWAVTGALLVVPVLIDRYDVGSERPASNLEHLAERLAGLTTIVIGESFIRVALTGSSRHFYEINFVIVCLEFLVVCSIWIAYFDSIAMAGMPPGTAATAMVAVGDLRTGFWPRHRSPVGPAPTTKTAELSSGKRPSPHHNIGMWWPECRHIRGADRVPPSQICRSGYIAQRDDISRAVAELDRDPRQGRRLGTAASQTTVSPFTESLERGRPSERLLLWLCSGVSGPPSGPSSNARDTSRHVVQI